MWDFSDWSDKMTRLESQIRELSPSVKEALFRRLLFAEDLAWLRDEKKKDRVIGFEVDLDDQELSGFALIAIQRHTVIAFVSDRNEPPRLILFPSLDILFDPGFELLGLIVTRKEFKDAKFEGIPMGHGKFGNMVKDFTPPERKMDLSETVVDQIANIIKVEEEAQQTESKNMVSKPETSSANETEENQGYEDPGYEEQPPEEFIDNDYDNYDGYEEPGCDDYDNYDGYEEPGYDDHDNYYEPESEPKKEMSRVEKLQAEKFNSLAEVIDFVVMKLGVNRPLAVTLANKAMQSKVSPEYRIQLAVNIFCKLINENRI